MQRVRFIPGLVNGTQIAGAALHLLTRTAIVAWAVLGTANPVFVRWLMGADMNAQAATMTAYLAIVAAGVGAYPLALLVAMWEKLGPGFNRLSTAQQGRLLVLAIAVYALLLWCRGQWKRRAVELRAWWRRQLGHGTTLVAGSADRRDTAEQADAGDDAYDDAAADGDESGWPPASVLPRWRRRRGDPFAELVGVEDVISEIRDVMELPLKHPRMLAEYRLTLPRAIMLHGPPGTGKTSIARAVAGWPAGGWRC